MKFTGHERDFGNPGGTGDDLDYMHARHESPLTGRFLSIDPINSARVGLPQSWNKYTYVLNDPVVLKDPTGKCAWDLCIGEATAAVAVGELILSAAATGYVLTKLHQVFFNESTEDPSAKKESSSRTEQGDAHRDVGDANRVKQDGREFIDAKTGNRIFVRGNRVVVTDEEGRIISQFKNPRANTRKRVSEGRWIPVK